MRLLAAAGLAAAFLAGCGSTRTGGKATLWITRDRGQEVVLTKLVKAGQTAMQALQPVAMVNTSYGGRCVQSSAGVSGDRSARRDWFYFVNGYEADQGAADYTLHPGDVEWWDYRNWNRSIHVPIVVGAFPEPFLHGYGGKTREAAVVYDSPALTSLAKRLGKLIHARTLNAQQLVTANVLYLTKADVPLSATAPAAGAPVRFVIGPTATRRLLADPGRVRDRYSGLR